MGKNKISVNFSEIMSASKSLKDAEKYISSAKSKIGSANVHSLSGAGMAPAGIMSNIKSNVTTIFGRESSLLSNLSRDLKNNANQLSSVDKKTNKIKHSEISEQEKKKGQKGLKTKKSGGNTQNKKTKKKKKKSKKVASLVAKIDAVPATQAIAALTVNTLVQPTTDIRVDSYNKLEEMLKSGNITSEAGALYDTLKTFGMGNEADSLLEKYGYKVSKDENGNTVISKIEKEVEVPINNEDSNKSDSNQSSDIPKTDEKPDSEVVATEVDNSNSTTNTNNSSASTEQSNNESYSNVRRTSYSSGNTNSNSNTTSTTVDSSNNTSGTINEPTSIVDNSNKVIEKKPSTNVVSIKDDTTKSTKKSNGMGAAIPIGLGAIATGAAAVAGVRYVKNRHDNQEEYDEDYDDENNQLDDNNSEYVDSAEYNNESDYKDDDYLGPAGSSYTDVDSNDNNDDNYVDPEELEMDTDDDFSDDAVLEQLNSN